MGNQKFEGNSLFIKGQVTRIKFGGDNLLCHYGEAVVLLP
jgi:hypothetical protein